MSFAHRSRCRRRSLEKSVVAETRRISGEYPQALRKRRFVRFRHDRDTASTVLIPLPRFPVSRPCFPRRKNRDRKSPLLPPRSTLRAPCSCRRSESPPHSPADVVSGGDQRRRRRCSINNTLTKRPVIIVFVIVVVVVVLAEHRISNVMAVFDDIQRYDEEIACTSMDEAYLTHVQDPILIRGIGNLTV